MNIIDHFRGGRYWMKKYLDMRDSFQASLEQVKDLQLRLHVKAHFEQPAPCDSPWIAKFVALEKDYQALEKQHYEALDRERAAKQRLQTLIFSD